MISRYVGGQSISRLPTPATAARFQNARSTRSPRASGSSTRVNDPKTSSMVIVMQRCHQRDLSGHLLEKGNFEHLCLPAEYEGPGRVTSIGFSDPRTEHGELLWGDRFGPQEIEDLKISLGSYGAAGQLQQRPSPAGGGIFKRHWFRYFQPRGVNLPPVVVRLPDGTPMSIPAIEAPE